MIHKRLILEAKREMVSQSKTIQAISDELGFENASYFARFFKKHEGVSPTVFMEQMFK
jgi:AraC-like DNA-binding protein